MSEHKIFPVYEYTTGRYTAKLVDEGNEPIPVGSINSISLSLRDAESEDVINGRDLQDVLNNNGVSIDSEGNLIWTFSPSDQPRFHTERHTEIHIADWVVIWSAATKQIKHRFFFRVTKV
jgi:hypothetical protein